MAEYWSGLDQVLGNANRAKQAKTAGARRGAALALRNVLNESNRTVPHEEGDLERDGAVSIADGATGIIGAVSYGRTADTKDYAVVQHERMDLRHDPGRGPKFLENAFNSTRQQNAEIIAEQIRREFEG